MYLDAQNMFSDDQTLIGTANDVVVSTNVIDLTNVASDVGEPLQILIQITTTQVGATSTTLFELFTDSAVGFGTEVFVIGTELIPVTSLVAGYQVSLNFMPRTVLRYVRLKYTIGTANITAGAFSAGIIIDRQAGEEATA